MTTRRLRSSRVRRRSHARLDLAEFLFLTLGPSAGAGPFADEADARDAWESHRDHLIERAVFHTHDAGWRPDAFWHFDADRDDLIPTDAQVMGRDPEGVNARLRWLWDHDAFLPSELDAMRQRAEHETRRRPAGARSTDAPYAIAAWAFLRPLIEASANAEVPTDSYDRR